MHLWRRLGIIQVNLASALALHKRCILRQHRQQKTTCFSVLQFIYDDNQDNFLTTCSCLSARRAYKIRGKTTESLKNAIARQTNCLSKAPARDAPHGTPLAFLWLFTREIGMLSAFFRKSV